MTSGHSARQHSVGGKKEPNPEAGLFCKTTVLPCSQVPDMNKRNCSRSIDTEKMKQPSAVCASRLDPGLNKPYAEDLKTNRGNSEY